MYMIKAVIFDMDGLLIDSEPLWSRAFKQAFGTIGITITDQDMFDIRGFRQIESVRYLYSKYHAKGASQKDIVSLIHADMMAMIKSDGKLLPGVRQALGVCQKAALPMAIASSSPTMIIDAVVDGLDIRGFFDQVHSGELEPYGKPHPGIFISTAELLGVAPDQCLVFEDAPSGVLAAKAARMKCVAVTDPELEEHPFIKTADAILDSLEDFDEAVLAGLEK